MSRKQIMAISELKKARKFQSQYLYLCFISLRGCTVNVTIRFPRGMMIVFKLTIEEEEQDSKSKRVESTGAGFIKKFRN